MMAQQGVDNRSFKLLIVGDRGTGKTALFKRLLTGVFERNYELTIRRESHMLDFLTNRGKISFTCLDIPAQDIFRRIQYKDADGAIILYDVTNRSTYDSVPTWYRDLRSHCRRNIPIALCGNKVEVKMGRPKPVPFFHSDRCHMYFEISVKSDYNLEKPFFYLAQKLIGDEKLHFVEPPSLAPPELQIDMTAQQLHETEIAEAAHQPLPDEDEEDDDDHFEFFSQDLSYVLLKLGLPQFLKFIR